MTANVELLIMTTKLTCCTGI